MTLNYFHKFNKDTILIYDKITFYKNLIFTFFSLNLLTNKFDLNNF